MRSRALWPISLFVGFLSCVTSGGATINRKALSLSDTLEANMISAYGHMVHNFYDAKLREIIQKRSQRLKKISTKAEAEAYVAEVRRKIKSCFEPFPERTPLNARTVGRIKRDGFVIEKVIFESRPHFPVTGLLYLPKERQGRCPAVLGVCGHSPNGKACDAYQRFCQGLALKGFVVFTFDPIDQGERLQFLGVEGAEEIATRCTWAHNMIGKQLRLCGAFFGTWRVWDAMRALDYLLSRPEVDPSRVGVTGNSGGGTLSTYVNALDDRVTMAAPSCFITTYLRNFENELPADSEQIPPGILAQGCEMADFVIARAPRPTLILGQKNDFFDPRGTFEAYEEARHIYAILGAEENVQLFIGPDSHGYSQSNREAMYGFFAEHAGLKADAKEPETVAELPEETLYCAPGGQIRNIAGIKTTVDYVREMAARLATERGKPDRGHIRSWLAVALHIVNPPPTPAYSVLRPRYVTLQNVPEGGRCLSRFGLKTEEGILCVMFLMNKETFFHLPEGEAATLYIPHLGAEEELKEGIVQAEAGELLFALDVRGIGESLPVTCNRSNDFFAPYDSDYFYTAYGIMMNEPYLGGKVRDVLSAVALLKAKGYKRIHLVGRGLGSIVAAFAAVLSDDVNAVTLVNAPVSFGSMIEQSVIKWPVSHMLPGMLKHFDMPDVYDALKEKDLKLIAPWDAAFEPVEQD